jgi:mannose-6-phosphate isomerase-like protein (cupin superfamily)
MEVVMEYHVSVDEARRRVLDAATAAPAALLCSDSVSVEFYAPRGSDLQTPHARDELYVVISGSARFRCCCKDVSVGPGDVLTVPAHYEHRFVDISDDFATWVVFHGPEVSQAAS